jgi:uncharacterized protein related to proFAR isomerase
VATDRYGIMTTEEIAMTQSVRSVNIIVRLDFKGDDVSHDAIEEAINNMDYSFNYDDYYLKIIDAEIVETFVENN